MCRSRRRYELRHGRFEDELPPCHAVVASLALHHVPTHDAKRELYRSILSALEPGGLVCVGDALVYEEGPERDRMVEDLFAHMGRHGFSVDEAAAHLAQWAEEDFYVSTSRRAEPHRGRRVPASDCFAEA